MNLDQLCLKYGCLKGSQYHNYMFEYGRWLGPLKESCQNFLELGVLKGQSLWVWRDYFPNAMIHGVDIKPACVELQEERITIHIGRQEDIMFLQNIVQNIGKLDVVVDDCEHQIDKQIISFLCLFPALRDGGFYIIEDLADRSLAMILDFITRLNSPDVYIASVFKGNKNETLLVVRKEDVNGSKKADLQFNT